MRFLIKGYRHRDGVISLNAEADSAEGARALAVAQGLQVIAIESSRRRNLLVPTRRFDLLLFSQEVHALLNAGLSLIEALGAIARKEPPSPKRTLVEQLIRQLQEGKSFSLALKSQPEHFPDLYLALVSASEQTGDLAHALARFISYRSQMDTVRRRVTSAMLYPALLTGVGGLVILFLMSYVVPRFARIYGEFNRDLPVMSKLLLQWGQLVSHHGPELLAGVALLAIWGIVIARRGLKLKSLLTASELLRRRIHLYEIARFYRTLGMLQQGGIPIVPALGMAAELLGEQLGNALTNAIVAIRAGAPFSRAMEDAGLAPPVAQDLLRVGEKSGDLGEKMIRIADFYDDELTRWIDWFTKLFEPLLMLGIGLFIALVVVLLYLPIFELAGTLQ